jgi:hypothetical protein
VVIQSRIGQAWASCIYIRVRWLVRHHVKRNDVFVRPCTVDRFLVPQGYSQVLSSGSSIKQWTGAALSGLSHARSCLRCLIGVHSSSAWVWRTVAEGVICAVGDWSLGYSTHWLDAPFDWHRSLEMA